MKQELANYPWVFWLKISYRPKWFSKWWKTRGSNAVEYQVWVFKISIGQPWLKCAVDAHQSSYGSAMYVHKCNKENLKMPLSFKMKPPRKCN